MTGCCHTFRRLLNHMEVVNARVDVVHRDHGPRHVDDLLGQSWSDDEVLA
jgi:hypothetical protein